MEELVRSVCESSAGGDAPSEQLPSIEISDTGTAAGLACDNLMLVKLHEVKTVLASKLLVWAGCTSVVSIYQNIYLVLFIWNNYYEGNNFDMTWFILKELDLLDDDDGDGGDFGTRRVTIGGENTDVGATGPTGTWLSDGTWLCGHTPDADTRPTATGHRRCEIYGKRITIYYLDHDAVGWLSFSFNSNHAGCVRASCLHS